MPLCAELSWGNTPGSPRPAACGSGSAGPGPLQHQQHLWARREVKAAGMCYPGQHAPMPAEHRAWATPGGQAHTPWGGAALFPLNDELYTGRATVRRVSLSFVPWLLYIYDME